MISLRKLETKMSGSKLNEMARKCALSLGAVLLLGGCSVSISKAPVGDAPLDITEVAEEWEGLWNLYVSDDDDVCSVGKEAVTPVSVEVRDASNGVLRVVITEFAAHNEMEKDDQSNLPVAYDVYLRRSGDWVFASIDLKDMEKTNSPPSFAWGRLRKGKRVAHLWWASERVLREWQDEGKAPPDVPDSSANTVLEAFNSNHVAQVTSGTNGVPFLWDTPWLFIKQD